MKFLTNENLPLPSVYHLREMGHDVLSISEHFPGISDDKVLSLACDQKRTLITFDRDYGELIFLQKLPAPTALIFLRFIPTSPVEAANIVLELVNRGDIEINGYYWVVTRNLVRRRPLLF